MNVSMLIDDFIYDVKERLDEIENALSGTPEYDSAKSYWIAHIRMALDDDHYFLGGSMITARDTANRLLDNDNER